MRVFYASDLRAMGAGERRLPESDYIGFAVGADSEHDCFSIQVPMLGTRRFGVGAPLIIEPVRFAPIIDAVRYGVEKAYVVAFECGDDIEAFGRAPYVLGDQAITIAAEGDVSVLVPFAGRTRIAVTIETDDDTGLSLWGRKYYGTGASDYREVALEENLAIAADTPVTHYEGDETDGEWFDVIQVLVGDGAGAAGASGTLDIEVR